MWPKIIAVVLGFVPQIIDSIAKARRAKRAEERKITEKLEEKQKPKPLDPNPYGE